MLHSKHLTLTANKTEATSTKTSFLVNQGVIFRAWIHFPPGCAGLVKVRIFHEGHPFLPVEIDSFIRGDDTTYVYPVMYEITDAPEQITIQAWNEDELYDHTIDVQFLIIDKKWIVPAGATEGIIAALKSLFVRQI